jgi:gentisate 1,2-dioxygenase
VPTTTTAPRGDTAAAAVFYVPEGSFERGLPDVPVHLFEAEQRQVLSAACPSGLVALDLSRALKTDYPATTPVLLARYAVVRAGDRLTHRFAATGEVYHVLRGRGETLAREADVFMAWSAGDSFVLPGADDVEHRAKTDSLLVCVTNEPELAYAGVRPPQASRNPVVRAAHFNGAVADQKLGLVHQRTGPQMTAGKSVIFANAAMGAMRTILPSMTAALNTLEPGGDQRPHRHNAAALTVALQGEGVYSEVAGTRVDWIPFGVMVTPPQAVHSHHNRGRQMMKSFVVQDGALYYQLRNPGFAWTG